MRCREEARGAIARPAWRGRARTENAPGAGFLDRPGRADDALALSPAYATAPSAVTRSGIAHAAWSEWSSSSARSESGSPRKPS